MKRIILAIVFAVFLLVSGFGLQIYRAEHAKPSDWRLAHPKPYLPYWSVDFVKAFDNLTFHLNEHGYWLVDDYSDPWYTVKSGSRRTIGQPVNYDHTIWLFGNSATFDPYVPDSYTWASQLQTLLNAHHYRERIMNMGMAMGAISLQVARLHDTSIQPGDTVIFLDGAADEAGQTYWQQVERGRTYAIAHQANFYHFIQPMLKVKTLKPSLNVPPDMFEDDTYHLDSRGDSLLAHYVFDSLTLI